MNPLGFDMALTLERRLFKSLERVILHHSTGKQPDGGCGRTDTPRLFSQEVFATS
jgi:hypothetical protein